MRRVIGMVTGGLWRVYCKEHCTYYSIFNGLCYGISLHESCGRNVNSEESGVETVKLYNYILEVEIHCIELLTWLSGVIDGELLVKCLLCSASDIKEYTMSLECAPRSRQDETPRTCFSLIFEHFWWCCAVWMISILNSSRINVQYDHLWRPCRTSYTDISQCNIL